MYDLESKPALKTKQNMILSSPTTQTAKKDA